MPFTPILTAEAIRRTKNSTAAGPNVDISKAFDVVRRNLLLAKIETSNLHLNIKRWFGGESG